jgi:hypothetical protein
LIHLPMGIKVKHFSCPLARSRKLVQASIWQTDCLKPCEILPLPSQNRAFSYIAYSEVAPLRRNRPWTASVAGRSTRKLVYASSKRPRGSLAARRLHAIGGEAMRVILVVALDLELGSSIRFPVHEDC